MPYGLMGNMMMLMMIMVMMMSCWQCQCTARAARISGGHQLTGSASALESPELCVICDEMCSGQVCMAAAIMTDVIGRPKAWVYGLQSLGAQPVAVPSS